MNASKSVLLVISLLAVCCADCAAKMPLNEEERKECVAACKNLAEMDCEAAEPTEIKWATCITHDECESGERCNERGLCEVSCVSRCIAARHTGEWESPSCKSSAQTCEEAASCELR